MKNEFKTQLHYTVLLKIIKDSCQTFYLFHAYFIVVHRKIPLRPLSVNHMHITKIKHIFFYQFLFHIAYLSQRLALQCCIHIHLFQIQVQKNGKSKCLQLFLREFSVNKSIGINLFYFYVSVESTWTLRPRSLILFLLLNLHPCCKW